MNSTSAMVGEASSTVALPRGERVDSFVDPYMPREKHQRRSPVTLPLWEEARP